MSEFHDGNEPRRGPNEASAGRPRFALRTLPTTAEPEIDGSVVLTGLLDVTTAVGFDVAVPEPSAFAALTCERILKPASASRRV